jgi:Flp pilus assembly protein TadD
MNFKPSKGLFQFDFNDQHAIIGIAVDSDAATIRNRYKEIARLMHPDSSRWATSAERDFAVKLFSSLISHAYGNLSRAAALQEQQMMLELLGKRLVSEASKIDISGSAAQELYKKNSTDLHQSYHQLLQELTHQQYRQLDQSIEITGQISELNMIYLLRKQNQAIRSAPISATDTYPAAGSPPLPQSSTTTNKNAEAPKVSTTQNSMRRAEEYINMRNWPKANIELREILKGDPTNVAAHAQLAIVYMRQNQMTMAKMHMNKAGQLNPNDPLVKTAQQEFKKITNSPSPVAKTTTDQNKGGLFGLFSKK